MRRNNFATLYNSMSMDPHGQKRRRKEREEREERERHCDEGAGDMPAVEVWKKSKASRSSASAPQSSLMQRGRAQAMDIDP